MPTPIPVPRAPTLLATLPAKGFDVFVHIAANQRTDQVYVSLSTYVKVLKGIEVSANLTTTQVWADGMAIDEVNNRVYLTNFFSNTVSVIQNMQLLTNVVTVGSDPRAVAVEPKSHWAYAVSGYQKRPNGSRGDVEGNILVLDGAEVIANLSLGRLIFTHVVADGNGYVYVGAAGGTIVVLKGLQEVARFEGIGKNGISGSIYDMSVHPHADEVYTLDGFSHVRKFKAGKLLAQEKILEEKPAAYTLIRIHPLTGQMYLLSKGAKEVSIYEGFQLVARVPIGNEAVSMEIDSLTGNVYVANAGDGTVSVIHDTQVLATIKTGWRPSAIGINPNNGWVYVSNVGDQTISVLGYPPPTFPPPAPTQAPIAPTAPTRAPTPKPYP